MNLISHGRIALGASLLLALAACNERGPAVPANTGRTSSVASSANSPASAGLQDWMGRWNGPEGTYLEVSAQADGKYLIAIMDLDNERQFEGAADGQGIAFVRDGQTEKVLATNGDATGMKWLAGKTDCLTVRVGEGYCRD